MCAFKTHTLHSYNKYLALFEIRNLFTFTFSRHFYSYKREQQNQQQSNDASATELVLEAFSKENESKEQVLEGQGFFYKINK